MIIAVDGPSGTGKSSVSRAVAERTELPHLDTGAFYRGATLAALRAGADLADPDAVNAAVTENSLTQEEGRMFLDGEDISERIRGEDVTTNVSQVSAHANLRTRLVDFQRSWVLAHKNRAVVEGRDIGTVVFPDATLKIYLDASAEVRAQRRAYESGEVVADVLRDQERRDRLDSSRAVSPLTVPKGAVVVDSSEMTLQQVVDHVVGLVDSVSA